MPVTLFKGMPWHESYPADEADTCPECGRLLKVYRRKITTAMAYSLTKLHKIQKLKPDQFTHIMKFDAVRGDFAKLKFWKIIEEGEGNGSIDTKSSGMWRITQYGLSFIMNNEEVPKYCLLKWGSEMIGFAGPALKMKDFLEHGNKFSYAKLMGIIPESEEE
ncbi:MAG: hypothetical protein GTN93_21455 [Anaerolineae bacterium]|nr:hypothetical protein [Anaerolineae bacterium]